MGEDISFGSCCYALFSVIERIMFVLVDRCAPLKIVFTQQGRVKEHNDGMSLRSVVDRSIFGRTLCRSLERKRLQSDANPFASVAKRPMT
jgi:hypothetical protein